MSNDILQPDDLETHLASLCDDAGASANYTEQLLRSIRELAKRPKAVEPYPSDTQKPPPSLAVAAHNLASILGIIVRMSDDVKNATGPLDAQGKLLAMQNSIQRNAARIAPHVKVVIDAVATEILDAATGQGDAA